MRIDVKNVAFKEQAAASPDPAGDGGGTFTGYASTWEKDLDGDVILKGAFTATLAGFGDNGAGIPIHWQHKDGSPNDIIGETLSAVEDDNGLLITARLDTDIPEGRRAYELLQRGLIHQMSIGYIAEKTAWVDDTDDPSPWSGYREIRQLKLFEISLVQVAANQGAEVLEVKSGRAISKANEEKIRRAYDALGELLDSITDRPDAPDPDPDEDPDDGDDPPAGDGTDDDKPKPGMKGPDPQWARQFQEISDFLSLADK